MQLKFTTIDAFTSTPYIGNPTAIIEVPPSCRQTLTQAKKQLIAREFNLSEVVFLHLPSTGLAATDSISIDIFTSHAEVPFAGHPTIGTSYFLLHHRGQGHIKQIITKAGEIPIAIDPDVDGGVVVEVPHNVHIHDCKFSYAQSTEATSPVVSIVNGMTFILVALPDLNRLGEVKGGVNPIDRIYDPSDLDVGWQNGLLTTYYYTPLGVDEIGRELFRTRMFGTREDPGTGSATSAFCCYTALKKPKSKGKGPFRFKITQGVEMGRTNEIFVTVERDDSGERIEKVLLGGSGVAVMKGALEI